MIESNELANSLYWGCYFIGFITIFIFNFFYADKYNISRKKGLLLTVTSYALIYSWAYLLAYVINGFKWGHHNAIRVYIWFPVLLLILAKPFKIDFDRACEYLAPSTCIVYGIARLGCIFAGCCHGISADWGMYSYVAGYKCFPVQLFESVTSLLIAAYVIVQAGKGGYHPNGKLYPKMLILYGGMRFIWEFFSAKESVFLGITELGWWAFFTCVIGIVWIVFRHRRTE